MIFKPAWALNASTSALLWRMISSIGKSNWKFTGLTLNLALASASGLMSCSFMRLLVLVCFSFHRRACLLGSQTTNRFSTIQGTFPWIGQIDTYAVRVRSAETVLGNRGERVVAIRQSKTVLRK